MAFRCVGSIKASQISRVEKETLKSKTKALFCGKIFNGDRL